MAKAKVKKVTVADAVKAQRYALFLHYCRFAGVPEPVAEYKFHPTRLHRMDFAWPDHKLGLEVEGGVWTRGRHGRGSGVVKDMAKHTLAAEEGWRIIRVTPDNLYMLSTIDSIEKALRFHVSQEKAP